MRRMVKNAGNASVKSVKSICVTSLIINTPMVMSTGAVACTGTNKNNGAKNKEPKYKRPVTTAVRPVRPPSATAAALSI